MELTEAVRLIEEAKEPADLFNSKFPKRRYRELANIVFPRTGSEGDEEAFKQLAFLWKSFNETVSFPEFFNLATKRRVYAVKTNSITQGSLAKIFTGSYQETGLVPSPIVVKISLSLKDGDLMTREAEVLKKFRADKSLEKFHPFVPELVDSFRNRDKSNKSERVINIFAPLEGFYSLTEVKTAYPDGISGADAAWMFRRLLVALEFAHRMGVLHGAVLPENIMIHPEKHGLVLVDWCYSVDIGQPLKAIVNKMDTSDMYPPEVFKKEPANESVDIYMAAEVLKYLLKEGEPKQFKAFINGCKISTPSMRPQGAWKLKKEFDELLERLYGKPKYREFKMPGKALVE